MYGNQFNHFFSVLNTLHICIYKTIKVMKKYLRLNELKKPIDNSSVKFHINNLSHISNQLKHRDGIINEYLIEDLRDVMSELNESINELIYNSNRKLEKKQKHYHTKNKNMVYGM